MSDGAPAPGWWLATDGQWYPPQWEYMSLTEVGNKTSLAEVVNSLAEKANALGVQGWEMVGFATASNVLPKGVTGKLTAMISVQSILKRPLRH